MSISKTLQTINEGDEIVIRHRGLSATAEVVSVAEIDDHRFVRVFHRDAGNLVFIVSDGRVTAIDEERGIIGPALGKMEVQ